MNIPHSIENLYIQLTTKKFFSSGLEDSLQINQELAELSQFFFEVSRKYRDTKLEDLTENKLQSLIRAYHGPRVRQRRILFCDEAVS